jgi:ribosome-associated protein YbcJ (S4-like RNA binding protein)
MATLFVFASLLKIAGLADIGAGGKQLVAQGLVTVDVLNESRY